MLLGITSCNDSTKPRANYKIGDRGPAGGFIFYDKGNSEDGWRYLEAAPANSEFNADWGAWTGNPGTWTDMVFYDVPGTETGIGTGKRNTTLIIAKLNELGQTGRAAQKCVGLTLNGFSDWFLPSIDELYLMYVNLHLEGNGDFGQGYNSDEWIWYYWSSSQNASNHALVQIFYDGFQYYSNECNQYRVRPCRDF